jgi:hypothetical protein
MLCGPKGSEGPSSRSCSVCGKDAELVELPGRAERYCLECSADVATTVLLIAEIDQATIAGQDAETLLAELSQWSSRLLARAQSA